MANSQKKGTQNPPRTRERASPKGQPSNPPPLSAPPRTVPTQAGKKGDGVIEPPSVAPEPAIEGTTLVPSLTPRRLIDALSVETALYVLIFVAAVVMRFAGLGARPLAEHEAAVAIAAWQFLQGQGSSIIGSPFLFSSNLLLFFLGAPTDTTVRIAPALIGSAVVLLPTLLRRELGRLGALIASLLLLFSSSLVFFARDSNGVEVSAVTGFAAAICLWRYSERGSKRDLYWGVSASAIALTASPAGFTLLLAGALFVPVFRWLLSREQGGLSVSEAATDGPISESVALDSIDRRTQWRNAAVLFAAVYVASATAFLMNRAGLGAAFNLLDEWLASFRTLGPVTSPFNLLLIYEPLALVFGLAGLLLVPGLRGQGLRSRGAMLFFASALLVGLIVYSLAGVKSGATVVVLVIPLAFLSGWFIGALFERGVEQVVKEVGWRGAIGGELPILTITLALAALVYLQLASLLQQSRFSPNIEALRQMISPNSVSGAFEAGALLLGLVTLVLGAFLIALAVGSVGAARAANLGALVVALLLALSGVRALWLVNFSGSDMTNELLAGEQTSLQARDLVRDLEWESQWRANDPHNIVGRADESLGPVARWYLRAFKNLQWVRQPQADANAQALLTSADAPTPPGVWVEQRYRLEAQWQAQNLTGVNLWKWLLFRDGGVKDWKDVRLWVTKPE